MWDFSWLFGEKKNKKAEPEPLVLGAKLQCPLTGQTGYLWVDTDDIDINHLPEACVKDCVKDYHILSFGECDGGFCQNQMELDSEWINPKPQRKLVNGSEIITKKSRLSCKKAGSYFKILTSGQEGTFVNWLLLTREMDGNYPGLRAVLENRYGSVYVDGDGMREKAIKFLEERLELRGGEIAIADLFYEDSPDNQYILTAIGRLVTTCDVRNQASVSEGLQHLLLFTGAESGDRYTLDSAMMEAIKKESQATAERIETKWYYRQMESNRRFSGWLSDGVMSMANMTVIYAGMVSESQRFKPKDDKGSDWIREEGEAVPAEEVKAGAKRSGDSGERGGGADDVATYRRVQGGSGTKSSQPRISVDETGKVSISNKNKNLNISVDGGEHSAYFKENRLGADVVEFDVPKWLDDFVNESAVPQTGYKSNPLSQGGTAPKITDVTTPGKSIEFPSPWVEWIEEYATNGRVIKGGP